VQLCELMLNGNAPTEFLHAYCDSKGTPRFVKAKCAQADRRIPWSWDTITGRANHKVAIGFYPWNSCGESRWAAIDFDAHDGCASRAKTFALAAFQILYRHPEFYLILATSGSAGWHLFIFSADFHPVEVWVRLLKRVIDQIGAEIKSGICEIFPDETRNGSRPHAIRAPGTWNPKTNQVGVIFFTSIAPLFSKERKKEVSSFLYHSTHKENRSQLNERGSRPLYCGGHQDWLEQFAIVQPGTRHAQLRGLAYCVFRQVGHCVGRELADRQHQAARVQPTATLAEHLEEFEQLWAWTANQWRCELSDLEQEMLSELETETERDLFRILRNFGRYAATKNKADFPFSIQNVADRLGVSFQYISKLRRRFVTASVIVPTAPFVTNRSAARFRWGIRNLDVAPASSIDA